MVRDVLLFVYVAFRTLTRGFDMSVVVVTSQLLKMPGEEWFIFNPIFIGKTLKGVLPSGNGEEEHRLSGKLCCGGECRQAAASMQWALARGSSF